jgi:hypothetical protein
MIHAGTYSPDTTTASKVKVCDQRTLRCRRPLDRGRVPVLSRTKLHPGVCTQGRPRLADVQRRAARPDPPGLHRCCRTAAQYSSRAVQHRLAATGTNALTSPPTTNDPRAESSGRRGRDRMPLPPDSQEIRQTPGECAGKFQPDDGPPRSTTVTEFWNPTGRADRRSSMAYRSHPLTAPAADLPVNVLERHAGLDPPRSGPQRARQAGPPQ